MNRIDKLFAAKKENILSVYFTAGYPQLDDTVPIITQLSDAGVNLIEVGIPFSDPMADGSVIQQSNAIALNNGMTLRTIFDQLQDIRQMTDIPLIMMGYLNPIMQYGIENFCRDCAQVGIDGMIIPDLPLADYLRDFFPVLDRYGLYCIMLITPETSEERIRLIDESTSGFIYMVSTASTTGARERFDEKTLDYFWRIDRMQLRNPRMIGFGISNRATFEAATKYAAGAIVGSEFIRILGEEDSTHAAVSAFTQKLRTLSPQSSDKAHKM
jgi:tryptophan synthase alpha chain